jgi:GNAT superfamily N-acetyltransferase
MKESIIKKITCLKEAEEVAKDIQELYQEDNEKYKHALDLKHDPNLIAKSICHESLLLWNIHAFAHFNGEKWDSLFIGMIRKSEKFGKKFMDEYLWLSKNSIAGMKLYKAAIDYARQHGCAYISMNVTENHPLSSKIKKFYLRNGFEKDTETYIKKL